MTSPEGASDPITPHVAKNIEDVARLENRDHVEMGVSDHFADLMTRFSGSMKYVWLHVAWFTVWIVANLGLFGLARFDAFPFGFLTMIVSLEAIFLSTFVLISQNRQAMQADRRAKVDLQVNLISEQEITKLISMMAELHEHLGLHPAQDQELDHMQQPTAVEKLADAADEAALSGSGPKSAADAEN